MDEPRKSSRRRRGLLALLMAGTAIISATGATMSLALFTDSVAAGSNTFSSGTVKIGINPTSTIVSMSNMMPGDAVTGPVVVTNSGQSMRYSITGLATNTDTKGLAALLVVTIKTADTVGGTTCTAWTGTTLNTLVTTVGYTETNLVGTGSSVHPNGGRVLASGSETLCFRVALPSTVTTGQSATTTMTFTFYAEQTANNP
jgi:hypothetical protein